MIHVHSYILDLIEYQFVIKVHVGGSPEPLLVELYRDRGDGTGIEQPTHFIMGDLDCERDIIDHLVNTVRLYPEVQPYLACMTLGGPVLTPEGHRLLVERGWVIDQGL